MIKTLQEKIDIAIDHELYGEDSYSGLEDAANKAIQELREAIKDLFYRSTDNDGLILASSVLALIGEKK